MNICMAVMSLAVKADDTTERLGLPLQTNKRQRGRRPHEMMITNPIVIFHTLQNDPNCKTNGVKYSNPVKHFAPNNRLSN